MILFCVHRKNTTVESIKKREEERKGGIENLDGLLQHIRLFNVGTRPPKKVKVVYRMMLALFTTMGSVAPEVEAKVDSDGPNRDGGRERGGNKFGPIR